MPGSLESRNILVAEDDDINSFVVQHMASAMGLNTDIVTNGMEAVEKLKFNHYDLVLMDIQMPLMDGYEATSYIRSHLQSDIPIIAMTALALKGEEEKCLSLGMNDYLSKPFSKETLSTSIEKALATAPKNTSEDPHLLREGATVIDISILYDVTGDDLAYMNMMLQTFIETVPQTIQKMADGIAAKDWDAVYKAAHFAKSSLSIIKVNKMFDAVLKMEALAKKQAEFEHLMSLQQQVAQSFAEAEKIIRKKIIAGDNLN